MIDFTKPITGRIWILGNDIDTDLIIPSRVLTEQDQNKIRLATLENIIPNFAQKVQENDFLITGKNFGCGSSREEAVYVLKSLGIAAIVAPSFARIFYRNAINVGIPPIVIPNLISNFEKKSCSFGSEGTQITLDLISGKISDRTKEKTFSFQPFPPFLHKYLLAGGAISYLKNNK
jgi:3-isopropylmalate/(R)-2-methylmalate dehydratase small subunit